jgi:MFS family permease
VQLAIIAAAVSYGAMSLVMTSTPISMHVMDHHSVDATANVIRGHLLAMFIPSLVSGWLISRLGILRMLWLGVLLNATCIAFSVSGQEIWQYRYALITLGVGWNFLFIAGTTLLATVCKRDEILRVQGINDFAMFATMAAASLSDGALLDSVGWVWTNLAALALLALVVVALLRVQGKEVEPQFY